MDTKILVTGSNGQLGREVLRALEARGLRAEGAGHAELDITDAEAVNAMLQQGQYSHVVNCAAYTAVDDAEEQKALCKQVNVQGVENIARAAEACDAKVLHISTDFVFDGTATAPYGEGAKPNPLSVYGSTKRRGETALLGLAPESIVIRTGWLYSAGGNNFVTKILAAARAGKQLEVVDDQIGTPTSAAELAGAIAHILAHPQWNPGIYHYSQEGLASRYDFAVAILLAAGMEAAAAAVVPVHTADNPRPALRPAYSVLDKKRIRATYGIRTGHWLAPLQHCVKAIINHQTNE